MWILPLVEHQYSLFTKKCFDFFDVGSTGFLTLEPFVKKTDFALLVDNVRSRHAGRAHRLSKRVFRIQQSRKPGLQL